MTLQQLSDADLSRWIAEFLEPQPTTSPSLYRVSGDGYWKSVLVGAKFEWQPCDFVNDPAMTVMLLGKLVFVMIEIALGNIKVHVYNPLNVKDQYVAYGTDISHLGRAVAVAFIMANDWKAV